jgi:uncharacterized membrane protein YidH (DUF202 family)
MDDDTAMGQTTDGSVESVDPVEPVEPVEPAASSVRTVGAREGLGAGIVGLGVLAVAMPAVVDQLPSVMDGGSAAFVLYGMSVMIGIFVIIAGVMVFVVRD